MLLPRFNLLIAVGRSTVAFSARQRTAELATDQAELVRTARPAQFAVRKLKAFGALSSGSCLREVR